MAQAADRTHGRVRALRHAEESGGGGDGSVISFSDFQLLMIQQSAEPLPVEERLV
jgi:hypothetical protein